MARRGPARSKSRGPGGNMSAAPPSGIRGRGMSSGHNATSSKPSVTTSATLEDHEWYHGLLPREDITKMLVSQGDFLVRRTEVLGSAKHVVSIFWDGKARHVVLHTNAAGNRHLIDPSDRDFATIQELIAHYTSTNAKLPRTDYILLKPVPRQEWELRHDQIVLGSKLGEGAFGEVFRATLRMRDGTTVPVAVKRSHTTRDLTKEEIAEIVAESRIMQKFKNEHLVRLYGVAAETQPVMLVLELVSGGGLDSYLQKNVGKVAPVMKVKFCVDAAKGTEYLHSHKCIHRDLACRNCLLTSDNVVKISDFGLSQEGTSFKMKASAKVPIRWLAPETITTMIYTPMTDVWAFGVLMWEIFHNGSEPYPGMKAPEVASQVKHGYKMDVSTDPDVPMAARNILLATWLSDAKARPNMADVRQRLEVVRTQMK